MTAGKPNAGFPGKPRIQTDITPHVPAEVAGNERYFRYFANPQWRISGRQSLEIIPYFGKPQVKILAEFPDQFQFPGISSRL